MSDESEVDYFSPPEDGELNDEGVSKTRRCPYCNARLYYSTYGAKRFICLNACHLGEAGQKRFNMFWRTVTGQ